MRIPICVYNGCKTTTVEIGDFQFEIGFDTLLTFFEYARLEMRDSCLRNRDSLTNSLHCMNEALRLEVRRQSYNPPTASENAKNLKRWQETGCGGHTDLDDAWEALGKAGMDDFRLIWKRRG
jgi:hypothetical protein